MTLNDDEVCTHVHWHSMGLPCAHVFKRLIRMKMPLRKSHFDQHWHIERDRTTTPLPPNDDTEPLAPLELIMGQIHTRHEELPPHQQGPFQNQLARFLEDQAQTIGSPIVTRSRGRPRASATRTSTREPSAFEQAASQGSGTRCGQCREIGHNVRTCPIPPE